MKRPQALALLLLGICTLPLLSCQSRSGPAESAWEVNADVPRSLENGRASRGPVRMPVKALAGMSGDLAQVSLTRDSEGLTEREALPAAGSMPDSSLLLPYDAAQEMVSVPKPGESTPSRRDKRRERAEILKLSSRGELSNVLVLPPSGVSNSMPESSRTRQIPGNSTADRGNDAGPSALLWPEQI